MRFSTNGHGVYFNDHDVYDILDNGNIFCQFLGHLLRLAFMLLWSMLFLWNIFVHLSDPNLTTFNCSRIKSSQFNCELTSRGIFGKDRTLISSRQLQAAEAVWEEGEYKLVLKTEKDKIYLPDSHQYSQEDSEQINYFIRNKTQKSLSFRKDSRWIHIPLAIFFGIGFWGFIFLSFLIGSIEAFFSYL